MSSLQERLAGVFCAMITPADGNNHVDEDSLRRLTRHLLAGGVNGLVVLGSSGELQAISDDDRKRAISTVVSETGGRVLVIAGAGDTNISRARQNIETARQLGADAVLVVPPHYYLLSQQGVMDYFRELAAVGFPILLYNIPNFSKVRIDPNTVQALSKVDNIIGIKDSSRDVEYLQEVVLRREDPNFKVFVGSDGLLLASLAIGVDGVIGVTPNIVPSWDVQLEKAFRDGDLAKARAIQQRIGKLLDALRTGNFPTGLKAATSLRGMCNPNMFKPATALSEQETAQIRNRLKELGIT